MGEESEGQSRHAPGWCSLMGDGAFPGEESRLTAVGWASYIKNSVHTPMPNKGFVFLTLPTFLKPTVAPHSSN